MIFTYYFLFFQVASATATIYGLSRGLLGLEYDRINISDSDSDTVLTIMLEVYVLNVVSSHDFATPFALVVAVMFAFGCNSSLPIIRSTSG